MDEQETNDLIEGGPTTTTGWISEVSKAAKHEHHFVPKMYLRNFGVSDRAINLHNIERALYVENASIADQCKRYNFYGPNNDLENWLADREGMCSQVLREIVDSGRPPKARSDSHYILLGFMALQMVRTHRSQRESVEMLTKMAQSLGPEVIAEPLEITKLLLSQVPALMKGMDDLKVVVLDGHSEVPFITSDAPVIEHNLLLEGTAFGTGVCSTGALYLFPLAPNRMIMLFDGTTYQSRVNNAGRSNKLIRSDVDSLNVLQVMQALNNVYFGQGHVRKDLDRAIQIGKRHRDPELIKVHELRANSGDARSMSMAGSTPGHGYRLKTSFLLVRPEFRRMSLSDLLNKRRLRRNDIAPASTRSFLDMQREFLNLAKQNRGVTL